MNARAEREPAEWGRDNVEHLALMLSATRLYVQAAGSDGPTGEADARHRQADELAQRMSRPPQVDALAAAFELSSFELWVVLLCACWELDRGDLVTWLDSRTGPTLGSAMALLPVPHWSACTPDGPLRAACLIELTGTDSIIAQPARLPEAVLHFLKGAPSISTELARISTPVVDRCALPAAAAHGVRQLLDQPGLIGPVQLIGRPWIVTAAAGAIAQSIDAPLRRLRAADLPTARDERDRVGALLCRDVRLGAFVPLFELERGASPDSLAAVAQCIDPSLPVALCASAEPVPLELMGLRTVPVGDPTPQETELVWREALGEHVEGVESQLQRLVTQFKLAPRQVESACRTWLATYDAARSPDPARLWDACIDVARPQLDGLAEQLSGRDGLSELVLPAAQGQILDSIVSQMRQRAKVDVEWGMHPSGRRGGGIAVLFSGPSGTGKTLAAEGLAWELRLPIFRVDLSSVVSKYIGETEKHLSKLFDAAETGGSVLLFDEADALFGKRSQVASAHDRYANIEVSYLLQRIESYSGLAILTTNHRANIDSAFLRRVRFVVNFPTPGVRQRASLWKRAFPDRVPLEALDYSRLAEFELTGGSIRNATLVAASLAADADGPVGMEIVLRAIRLELGKQGKVIPAHLSPSG